MAEAPWGGFAFIPNGADYSNDTGITYDTDHGLYVHYDGALFNPPTCCDPVVTWGWVYQGKTFSHWNRKADDSGIVFEAGDTLDYRSTGPFYAIWEDSASPIADATYKGAVIGSLLRDGSLTLGEAGKYLEDDITIRVYDDNAVLTVEYNGETIIDTGGGGGLSDLTGTTWYFNSSLIQLPSSQTDYHVTYRLQGNNGDRSIIRMTSTELLFCDAVGSLVIITGDGYSNGSWSSAGIRTITFTGGTDAANADLIAFIQANAVQQS